MRTPNLVITFAASSLLIGAITGCASKSSTKPTASAAATQPTVVAVEKSGAQLWSENCMRCHNLRSPETFSPIQWELAVHHMRMRANLTGQEARKITEFLRSAS